jgi:prophage regulatory protein
MMVNQTHSELTILRRPQVQQRTGLSRSTLYQYIKEGVFPRSISLGPRSVGWLESDVSDWIAQRIRISRKNAGRLAQQ